MTSSSNAASKLSTLPSTASNSPTSTSTPPPTTNNNNNNNTGGSTSLSNTSSHGIISPTSSRQRDPTIRHAGRTHIRGKIRRVWRPRYLELCDTGLVRYYELPPTADVTLPEDSDWDHVHMIPKSSLVIYHARIIDVTTLRDLHVGLPRGSYGFLFRGQRQPSKELFTHQANEPDPPRDYFCAVSTLEEAQTWVIALQWAATVGQELRPRTVLNQNPLSRLECYNPNHQYQQEQQQQQQQQQQNATNTDMDTSATTATTATEIPPEGNNKPSSSSSRQGRILVTKGNKIEERRLLRTRQELVTLIQQLSTQIIVTNNNNDTKNIRNNSRNKSKNKKKNGGNILDIPNQLLNRLPTRFTSENQIIISFETVDRVLRHLVLESKVVNSQALKRYLALDNSTRLQIKPSPRVFGELYKSNTSNSIIARYMRSVSSDAREDYVKRWLKTTNLSSSSSTSKSRTSRHYHDDSAAATIFPLWILQWPLLFWGCVGVLIAIMVPIWNLYHQYIIVSVTIRLDVLALSWVLAMYIGRQYNMTSSSSIGTLRQSRGLNRIKSSVGPASSGLPSSISSTATSSNTGIVDTTTTAAPDEPAILGVGDNDEGDDDDEDLSSEEEIDEEEEDGEAIDKDSHRLSSPLPQYPDNNGESCWSIPPDVSIFKVRGSNYLQDRIKLPSGPSPFVCRGVDLWLTDNPERHIARHPSVLGGKLLGLTSNNGEGGQRGKDTFLVNFLLPFGNFVSYFEIPPLDEFPEKLAMVWTKFLQGDQQYRDARLKMLPIVVDGPWIVKAAVGNGTAPALLGKVIPLQYFFRDPTPTCPGIYEVDVIITASSIAKGILSVVKGHTKSLTLAFAFIIEAALPEELPETALCSFQVHSLHLEDCPHLPAYNLDEMDSPLSTRPID